MSVAPKPEGYSTVSPYLVVESAERVIDFLRRTFDATPLRRYERPDGSVMHAEVRIEDTVVMLADATEQWPAYASMLHVYVPDVDSAYRRAIEAGGGSIQEPMQTGSEPERRGGVMDPAGNSWWMAMQVE